MARSPGSISTRTPLCVAAGPEVSDFNPRFVPDLAAIDELLDNPAGFVGVDMRSRSQVALAAARVAAPKKSGRLADELVVAEQEVDGQTWFEVFSLAPYAAYVSEGTAGHPVDATHAQALHFVIGSVDVFVTHVDIPAIPPNPYLIAGIIAAMGDLT